MTFTNSSKTNSFPEIQEGVIHEMKLHEEANPDVAYEFHGPFENLEDIYSKFYEIIGYEGYGFIPSWWESCTTKNSETVRTLTNTYHIYSISLEWGKRLGSGFVPSLRHTCTYVTPKTISQNNLDLSLNELMDRLDLLHTKYE